MIRIAIYFVNWNKFVEGGGVEDKDVSKLDLRNFVVKVKLISWDSAGWYGSSGTTGSSALWHGDFSLIQIKSSNLQ